MSKRTSFIVGCVVVAVVIVGVYSLISRGLVKAPHTEDTQPASSSGATAVGSVDTEENAQQSSMQMAKPPALRPDLLVKPRTESTRFQDVLTHAGGLVISPAVKIIIGLEKEHRGYKDRRAALLTLTRRIPKDDVKALRAFLTTKSSDQTELNALTFNAVKNDVMDVLLRQENVPDAMGTQMAEMYRDKEHDDIWRDYCIQYLGPYYDIRWPAGVKADEDAERKDVEAAYWEALKETDKTFAGTALLGIERLSRSRPEIGRTNIADTAVALATNEACIEANRITAFRVAALMNQKEVLPSARVTAQTGATGPLRMAAIATIGDLGDAADRELLQSFAAGQEKRIVTVAEAALKRLNARQATVTAQK